MDALHLLYWRCPRRNPYAAHLNGRRVISALFCGSVLWVCSSAARNFMFEMCGSESACDEWDAAGGMTRVAAVVLNITAVVLHG